MRKGYVQVYTGSGKGKTTAALGLVLRAVGAGLSTCVIQFMKSGRSSELKALAMLEKTAAPASGVRVEQYGTGQWIAGPPDERQIERAAEGVRAARTAVDSGAFDLVVLDEINEAVHLGLVPLRAVMDLLESRPPTVELVLTGRNAPAALIDAADLVTEMVEVKHYFESGVQARRGIEM